MTELQLYRFIAENQIEWKYEFNEENSDVLIFVPTYHIDEFNKLLPNTIFDERGLECTMKDRYIAFWMQEICEYSGIDMYNVFIKD